VPDFVKVNRDSVLPSFLRVRGRRRRFEKDRAASGEIFKRSAKAT
jgi:hypothetical protein